MHHSKSTLYFPDSMRTVIHVGALRSPTQLRLTLVSSFIWVTATQHLIHEMQVLCQLAEMPEDYHGTPLKAWLVNKGSCTEDDVAVLAGIDPGAGTVLTGTFTTALQAATHQHDNKAGHLISRNSLTP
jgi:hypothetical protein